MTQIGLTEQSHKDEYFNCLEVQHQSLILWPPKALFSSYTL